MQKLLSPLLYPCVLGRAGGWFEETYFFGIGFERPASKHTIDVASTKRIPTVVPSFLFQLMHGI
jgi:hypothetical protein